MGTLAKFDVLPTLGSANRGVANATSANSSGAAVDLQAYVNPGGRQLKAYLNVGAVTSTGYLIVKIQESTTTGESGFSDISGAAFTATGSSASLTGGEAIHFKTNNRYVRAIGTASNTAQIEYSCYVVAEARVE